MNIEQIGKNVFVMIDELFYDVVVGAIELPTKLVMIDTGMNLRKIKEFRKRIEEKTKKKFEYVLITHYHGDHIIGNQIFSDCKIIASKWTAEKIKSNFKNWTEEEIEAQKKRINDPLALEGLMPTPANESFENKLEIIDGNEKVTIKQTGGHTKGSSFILYKKVLFGGDNLFIESYPWGGDESCDPEKWITAYKEFLGMDIDYFVPGHGPISSKVEVKYILDYFEFVKKTMITLSLEGKTEDDILKQCYDIPHYEIDETVDGDVEMKQLTLKKWYDIWVKKEE